MLAAKTLECRVPQINFGNLKLELVGDSTTVTTFSSKKTQENSFGQVLKQLGVQEKNAHEFIKGGATLPELMEGLQQMPSATNPDIANESCAVLVYQLNDGFSQHMKWVGFTPDSTRRLTEHIGETIRQLKLRRYRLAILPGGFQELYGEKSADAECFARLSAKPSNKPRSPTSSHMGCTRWQAGIRSGVGISSLMQRTWRPSGDGSEAP